MSQRTDRLDSQIRHELMDLLQREMQDPRLGFVTITRVETFIDCTDTTRATHVDDVELSRLRGQVEKRIWEAIDGMRGGHLRTTVPSTAPPPSCGALRVARA